MADTFYDATLSFGLVPNLPIYAAEQAYAHSPARCDADITHWFSILNNGNQNGQAWAEISFSPSNLLIPFFTLETQPDSVNSGNNYWHFDEITPGQAARIEFITQAAGPQFEGQTVDVHFRIYYYDQNGNFLFIDDQTFEYEFECNEAFNTKIVEPLRIEPEHYFVAEDIFNYEIRFQNLQSGAIQQVQISDLLDENLDWSTFKPTHSSHYFETLISNPTGEVIFQFPDILLQDTFTNESSGYIVYAVAPKQDLVEGTRVENYAEISLGPNAPVSTDTVFNTFTACGEADPIFNMINFPDPVMIDQVICVGDSIEIGGDFYSEEGIYFIDMMSSENCDSSIILDLEHLPMIELLDVSIINDDGSNNGSITPSFMGGNPPYSYEWANGAIEAMIFGLTGGDYTLFVTDASGCTADFTFTVAEPVSLTNKLINTPLQIFPNPVKVNQELWILSEEKSISEVQLFNAWGLKQPISVLDQNLFAAPNQAGVYWLKCVIDGNTISTRIIVVD